MKKSISILPNREFYFGSLSMLIPTLFWISLISALFFSSPELMDSIFVAIDKKAPFISFILMLALPSIGFATNVWSMYKAYYKNEGVFVPSYIWNIAIILYSGFSSFILVVYLLFENYL